MTTAKIAVSVPEEVLRRARRAVRRGRAASMSAYVAAALEQKTKLDDLERAAGRSPRRSVGLQTGQSSVDASERRARDERLGLG